jgi:hypothetical protein
MRIAWEGRDEVGRDAHDNERGDPMEDMIGEDGRSVHLVGGAGGGAVVTCAVSSHYV